MNEFSTPPRDVSRERSAHWLASAKLLRGGGGLGRLHGVGNAYRHRSREPVEGAHSSVGGDHTAARGQAIGARIGGPKRSRRQIGRQAQSAEVGSSSEGGTPASVGRRAKRGASVDQGDSGHRSVQRFGDVIFCKRGQQQVDLFGCVDGVDTAAARAPRPIRRRSLLPSRARPSSRLAQCGWLNKSGSRSMMTSSNT